MIPSFTSGESMIIALKHADYREKIFSLENRRHGNRMSILRTSRVLANGNLCFSPMLVLNDFSECHGSHWATIQNMQLGRKCKLLLGCQVINDPRQIELLSDPRHSSPLHIRTRILHHRYHVPPQIFHRYGHLLLSLSYNVN